MFCSLLRERDGAGFRLLGVDLVDFSHATSRNT
jgi:hypothetical protein